MAEAGRPRLDWIAAVLTRELGVPAAVSHVEERTRYGLYRAATPQGPLLVKLGHTPQLAREASNLRRAAGLVGDLAPTLVAFVPAESERALLVMELLPGGPAEPGGLTGAVWRRLLEGLLRLHCQGDGGPPVCFPFSPDFITLSASRQYYVDLPQLRPLIASGGRRARGLDLEAALSLFDELAAEIEASPALFSRPPRLVHGDLWPENLLIDRSRCWLVDWIDLGLSDYALDLANLNLMLDWLWPTWRAHRAFERVLRLYTATFDDRTLVERMRVYLPLVSLVHLVQFGRSDPDDPETAAAMRACLATGQRDRALWRLREPEARFVYALTHPRPSEYSIGAEPAIPASLRRALRPLVRAGRRVAARSIARRRAAGSWTSGR